MSWYIQLREWYIPQLFHKKLELKSIEKPTPHWLWIQAPMFKVYTHAKYQERGIHTWCGYIDAFGTAWLT